jgi:RHS repeat-associated protein
MLVYLVLTDGGKVEFLATQHSEYDGELHQWTYWYTYVAQAIIDPYGLRTTLTYNADGSLYEIKEPAGRWIHLFYVTIAATNERVIDYITASDGRTVDYAYGWMAFSPGTYVYAFLGNVTYYNDATVKAYYSYQAPNVGSANGAPLLATCDDPMYDGPMKKLSYTYKTGVNGDNSTPVVGQILYENSGTTGDHVSTLQVIVSGRSEVKPDGSFRNFTIPSGYQITSWSDFVNFRFANQQYDANAFLSAFTDRNGNTTNFACDAVTGNVLQVTYPLTPNDTPSGTPRGTVSYVYGSASCPDPNNHDPHYLYSATDEGGHTTVYLRDTNKRIARINYPDGGYETFTYNSFGEVLQHQMTTGGTEAFTYDNTNGRKLTYRDALHDPIGQTGNPSAWYQYDTLGRLSGVTDALGTASGDVNHTTNYAYNARGQVTVTTHPVDPNDGQRHTITNVYNNNTGTRTSVTDELNHVTSYTYDDYRRVRSVTTPGHDTPLTTNIFYDQSAAGDDYRLTAPAVTYVQRPTGEYDRSFYDANLRKLWTVVAQATPDAAVTSYGYDYEGNVTSVVAPNEQSGQPFAGRSTTTSYDERNRPYQVTDPLNNTTTFKYDARGRKASVSRSNGQVVTFDSYDTMNRLLQQTATQTPDPSAVTKYTYYPSGLLHTMKDPRLVAIGSSYSYSYVYDYMGRKTSLTYPPDSGGAQKTEVSHYDTAGRLDTFTNRDGKIQTISYDQLNRVIQSSWNDGGTTPTVTYGYDAAGRTLSITNANATITRAYFNDNLLKLETSRYADAVDRTVNYTYDNDGRRASLKYPNNAYTFNYTYTYRSQLDTIVNNANNTTVANYDYDVNGNVTARGLNNSTSSTYAYDALNRATSISHALTSGTPSTRTLTYDYDSVGNRKWVKRDGGNGDVYGYDLTDQVTATKLDIANPDTTGAGPQTIVYDANGNRTSFAAYGTTDTYTINQLNQYTNRNTNQAVYDTKGNLTTGLDTSSYTYDSQSRLLTATKGGTTDTFKYDGLNRQISRKVGNAAVVYNVYDGWDLVGEYASGSSNATRAYLFGPTGLVKNLTTNRYYYQDASGSTTHLASSTGAILEWYRYDLQGTPIFYNANNTQITATAYNVRHLFTGQQWYSEVGLYDLRNRYYSPDIGRFLQADPSGFNGDAGNLYRYCHNNPLTHFDPMGYTDHTWPGNGALINDSDMPAVYYTDSGPHVLGPNSSTPNSPFHSVDVDSVNYLGPLYYVPGGQTVAIQPDGRVTQVVFPALSMPALTLPPDSRRGPGTLGAGSSANSDGSVRLVQFSVTGGSSGGSYYRFSDASYGVYDAKGNGYYIWSPDGQPGEQVGETTNGDPIYLGNAPTGFGLGPTAAQNAVHQANLQAISDAQAFANQGLQPNMHDPELSANYSLMARLGMMGRGAAGKWRGHFQ